LNELLSRRKSELRDLRNSSDYCTLIALYMYIKFVYYIHIHKKKLYM